MKNILTEQPDCAERASYILPLYFLMPQIIYIGIRGLELLILFVSITFLILIGGQEY
jgi:hypothetical protein